MNRIAASAFLVLAFAPVAEAESQNVSQIEIVSETLPSGYRVVIARTPPIAGRSPRIHIGSYVLHGSMQETRGGLAHLIEHVVANNRSTIQGPTRDTSVKFLESNALTRPYYTSFVSVVPAALLPFALHTRMARAGRASNDSAVFANEVGRVLAEVERDKSGHHPAYKAVVSLALGRSPRIADELDLVRNTKREDLKRVIDPIYRPDNAVLVIAGDLDIDSTRALVRETEARLKLAEVRSTTPVRSIKPTIRMGRSQVVKEQNRSPHNVIAIAWPKPPFGDADQIPLLIANELMLGRGESVDDPARNNESPIAIQLRKAFSGLDFSDGRASRWQAPDLVDTGPGLQAVVFSTDSSLTPNQVRKTIKASIREIRTNSMSDADIARARESLASFYDRWFFEPTYRILADHLMAYAATGRNPQDVRNIPSTIRGTSPAAVRKAFDRYVLSVEPDIVIQPRQTPQSL